VGIYDLLLQTLLHALNVVYINVGGGRARAGGAGKDWTK